MTDSGLGDKLNRFLDLLLDSMQKAGDFAAEQAPLVVQELIVWKRVWFAIMCVLSLVAAAVLYKVGKKFKAKFDLEQEKCRYGNEGWMAATVLSWAGSIGCAFVWFPASLYYETMVLFAPRLYVIEYIAGMIKGK